MPWVMLVYNFLKTFWWVILLVVAVILFICGGFLFKGKVKVDAETKENFVKKVANQVGYAVADVKLERAIIKYKSEAKRSELEEIRAEKDGKKRREKLAEFLEKNL